MKPRTVTTIYKKVLARSGPEMRPNQILLDENDEALTTQSDFNHKLFEGGGGPGPGPAPDLTDYATIAYSDQKDASLNGALSTRIDKNEQAIVSTNATVSTNSSDISSLQEGFDDAVKAAQDGAENIEIEFQSTAKKADTYTKTQCDATFAKKEDIPEGADLSAYAKTEYVDAADDQIKTEVGSAASKAEQAMEKAVANEEAIAAIEIPEDQDLSAYAKKTDIPTDNKDLANGAGYITLDEVPESPSGSDFSGSYNDLTDKPNIPSNTSQLTNDSGFITAADVPEVEVPDQVTYQLQTDAVLRAGEPAIELVDSNGMFTNVKFFGEGGIGITSDANSLKISAQPLREEVIEKVPPLVNQKLKDYAKKEDIPTDNKDLTNGAGYITAADVPSGGDVDLSEYARLDGATFSGEITSSAAISLNDVPGEYARETIRISGIDDWEKGGPGIDIQTGDQGSQCKIRGDSLVLTKEKWNGWSSYSAESFVLYDSERNSIIRASSIDGSITATSFIGDGSQLTNLPSASAEIDWENLPVLTA